MRLNVLTNILLKKVDVKNTVFEFKNHTQPTFVLGPKYLLHLSSFHVFVLEYIWCVCIGVRFMCLYLSTFHVFVLEYI